MLYTVLNFFNTFVESMKKLHYSILQGTNLKLKKLSNTYKIGLLSDLFCLKELKKGLINFSLYLNISVF